MASTFTTNIGLEEPARGDDVGTWDTPVNANMTLLDRTFGNTTIAVTGNITLSAAQFQSGTITLTSTPPVGTSTLTFPSTFTKAYTIQNQIVTNPLLYIVTLATTVSSGQAIGVPPGETITAFNDGTNLKFVNLGRVGELLWFGSSTVLYTQWNTACTVPPYLSCTGVTFSSATYPVLSAMLGSTTTPVVAGVSTGFVLIRAG